MAKYNWRTHEWNVGDKCVIRGRTPESIGWQWKVAEVLAGDNIFLESSGGQRGVYHRATCIPLRKKKRMEYWAGRPNNLERFRLFEMKPNDLVHDGKVVSVRDWEWIKVKEVKV